MSDKEFMRIAEIVAEKTSRRDFLGWLGRMAAGLIGALGLMSLGAVRAEAADTCTTVAHWSVSGEGITYCACDANEAVEGLKQLLELNCSSSAGADNCDGKTCPGDTANNHTRCNGNLATATIKTREAEGADNCPNYCATDTAPVVAYVDGDFTCKCGCQAKIIPSIKCAGVPKWTIFRRITTTETNEDKARADLLKKAAVHCQNSPAVTVACGWALPASCNKGYVCKQFAAASMQGDGGWHIDGPVECTCKCLPG